MLQRGSGYERGFGGQTELARRPDTVACYARQVVAKGHGTAFTAMYKVQETTGQKSKPETARGGR